MESNRFPEKYAIDGDVLRQATEDYIVIRDAGYDSQFKRELEESMPHGGEIYQRMLARRSSVNRFTIDRLARELSDILECPQHQTAAAIFEAAGPTKRQYAVDLLRKMAGEVRRLQARSFKPRRTA